jgi:membrane associated rhomboid family serine protease
MMTITPTVKQLLIINVLFYIGSQIIGASAYEQLSLYYFESEKFKFWQPLTHMFMHAEIPNITHILFNMFALYSFGSALEHFWGGKKFLFFYISCGLGATLLHSLVNYYQFHEGLNLLLDAKFSKTDIYSLLNQGKIDTRWIDTLGKAGLDTLGGSFAVPAVGASGAIYGLLVAFAFMFPTAELAMMFIPVPIKAKYFVPGIIAVDLFLGLKGNSIFGSGGTGVAHFAHIGGALIGFLMMWYWKKNQFDKNRWDK